MGHGMLETATRFRSGTAALVYNLQYRSIGRQQRDSELRRREVCLKMSGQTVDD
jgi:hypothetical protein